MLLRSSLETFLVAALFSVSGVLGNDEYYEGNGQSTPEYQKTTDNDIEIHITNIVDDLNTQFIPVSDHSQRLDLHADFTLLSLTNFDEISGEISVVLSLNLSWEASNLPRWNPKYLGDIKTYALPVEKIWTPRLLLLNPAKDVNDLASLSDRVRITSNGTVLWQIISGVQASCAVDVASFPFDEQTCYINIAIWGYDTREIGIVSKLKKAENSFMENSAWSLQDTQVADMEVGATPYLQASLRIARHAEYFFINILLPPVLLSLLSPCVFLLPAASGERMAFAITCFLAFGVFMGVLSGSMPQSSVPVAHLSYYLMYMLIQSCAVTFCTIMTLRVYNKDQTSEGVPDWLQAFVRTLRLQSCRDRCRRRNTDQQSKPLKNAVDPERTSTPVVKFDLKDPLARRESLAISRKYFTASAGSSDSGNGGVLEVKWSTVGRTLDAFFFIAFLSWLIFTSVSFIMALRLL